MLMQHCTESTLMHALWPELQNHGCANHVQSLRDHKRMATQGQVKHAYCTWDVYRKYGCILKSV